MFTRRSAKKRQALRDALWPEAEGQTWPPTNREGGWARMPRTIAVLACVMAENSKGADLLRTYLELLARTPEEGIVEIGNEEEHAALAGFTANARGVRSWRDRLQALKALGFIKVFGASRGIDQVVMVHPRFPVKDLRLAGKVSDELWAQYCKVVVDTTGQAPGESEKEAASG